MKYIEIWTSPFHCFGVMGLVHIFNSFWLTLKLLAIAHMLLALYGKSKGSYFAHLLFTHRTTQLGWFCFFYFVLFRGESTIWRVSFFSTQQGNFEASKKKNSHLATTSYLPPHLPALPFAPPRTRRSTSWSPTPPLAAQWGKVPRKTRFATAPLRLGELWVL